MPRSRRTAQRLGDVGVGPETRRVGGRHSVRDAVYVNSDEVVALSAIRAAPEPVVGPLRAALQRVHQATAPDNTNRDMVTVMAEKSLPYPVLRRIVASCAAADYTKVSFAVVEREQAYAGLPPH